MNSMLFSTANDSYYIYLNPCLRTVSISEIDFQVTCPKYSLRHAEVDALSQTSCCLHQRIIELSVKP